MKEGNGIASILFESFLQLNCVVSFRAFCMCATDKVSKKVHISRESIHFAVRKLSAALGFLSQNPVSSLKSHPPGKHRVAGIPLGQEGRQKNPAFVQSDEPGRVQSAHRNIR